MNEAKKDRREPIRTIKPRNFVAKNAGATTSGAGAHKDKKKAMKQGDVKHKNQEYAESLQHMLESALRNKEDLQAKRKTLQDLSMNKDVDQKAVTQRKLDLEKEARKKGIAEDSNKKYDHEAKMAKGELLQIAKNAMSIYQMIHEGDNLDGWVASYITVANDHLNSVQEQMEGDNVQGISESEGEPEGLPELTVDLAKHIRNQIGTEGPNAICKSVEWGDGAADDLVVLIKNALDDYIEANVQEGYQDDSSINEIKKGQKDANGFTKCWPNHHAVGTKKGKNGGQVRKCVPNEDVEESGGGQPAAIAIAKRESGKYTKDGKRKKNSEGWTHESLAAELFETENTYEQQLAGKLARQLKNNK
jgi:hypothetical protein